MPMQDNVTKVVELFFKETVLRLENDKEILNNIKSYFARVSNVDDKITDLTVLLTLPIFQTWVSEHAETAPDICAYLVYEYAKYTALKEYQSPQKLQNFVEAMTQAVKKNGYVPDYIANQALLTSVYTVAIPYGVLIALTGGLLSPLALATFPIARVGAKAAVKTEVVASSEAYQSACENIAEELKNLIFQGKFPKSLDVLRGRPAGWSVIDTVYGMKIDNARVAKIAIIEALRQEAPEFQMFMYEKIQECQVILAEFMHLSLGVKSKKLDGETGTLKELKKDLFRARWKCMEKILDDNSLKLTKSICQALRHYQFKSLTEELKGAIQTYKGSKLFSEISDKRADQVGEIEEEIDRLNQLILEKSTQKLDLDFDLISALVTFVENIRKEVNSEHAKQSHITFIKPNSQLGSFLNKVLDIIDPNKEIRKNTVLNAVPLDFVPPTAIREFEAHNRL